MAVAEAVDVAGVAVAEADVAGCRRAKKFSVSDSKMHPLNTQTHSVASTSLLCTQIVLVSRLRCDISDLADM